MSKLDDSILYIYYTQQIIFIDTSIFYAFYSIEYIDFFMQIYMLYVNGQPDCVSFKRDELETLVEEMGYQNWLIATGATVEDGKIVAQNRKKEKEEISESNKDLFYCLDYINKIENKLNDIVNSMYEFRKDCMMKATKK